MEGVYETLSARIDELLEAHKRPLLSTAGSHSGMNELKTRSEAHERAIREIAAAVEELAARLTASR